MKKNCNDAVSSDHKLLGEADCATADPSANPQKNTTDREHVPNCTISSARSPTGICGHPMFARPDLGPTGTIAYAAITCALMLMSYTVINENGKRLRDVLTKLSSINILMLMPDLTPSIVSGFMTFAGALVKQLR